MTSLNPYPERVDGVDVDAVAAAVRGCAAVDDLQGDPLGSLTSYLPGRRVAGVRVAEDRVTIGVRARWGVPVSELAVQVRAAVTTLVAPRLVDITVTDVADPSEEVAASTPAPGTTPAALGALSSAPTIPTAAETLNGS